MRTRNPEALSCACASLCDWLVTSGTVEVAGPCETVRLIVVFGGWNEPGPGLMPMTVSFGWSDFTSVRDTAKPFASRVEFAVSKLDPMTFGTATGVGPFETLRRTRESCSTETPAIGDCETTSPCGLSDSTVTVLHLRLAAWSAAKASSSFLPTTSGTWVFGAPVET